MTCFKDDAPDAGDSERVGRSGGCWKGDRTAPSLADSLRMFLVRICPSFSILCSNTVHSRFEDGRLREANIAPVLVREVLFPLCRGDIGEETTRFTSLGRVGCDCSSVPGGEVPGVWILPLEPRGLDVDASKGW